MKISVAMASYNGEKYIREQLDSIRAQTRPADELIVVDDCSTDGTIRILKEYREEHPGFPIHIYRNRTNLGYMKNFRAAARLTVGDLVLFCDQDDIWMEEKIETLAGIMEEHAEILAAASSFDLIDGEGKPFFQEKREGWCNNNLYHREVKEDALVQVPLTDLLLHNFCQGCAEIMRRSVVDEFVKEYRGRIPHDWFANLIAAHEGGLYFYNHPLFQYRIHEHNALGLAPKVSWKQKLAPEIRTLDARQSRNVLLELHRIAPEMFDRKSQDAAAREAQDQKDFIQDYLKAVEEKKTFRMLGMYGNPRYREIRSREGWAADVFCSVFGKKPGRL